MERHKSIAVALWALTSLLLLARHGAVDAAWGRILLLTMLLLPVLFYRTIAELARIGPMPWLASDFKSRNRALPFAFLFWLVFIIGVAAVLFDWSFY